MKTKFSTAISLLLGVTGIFAQPTISSYASTSPALEASLPPLDDMYEVPDTQVTSVNRVSFSSRIDFPIGTTSATVNTATFSLKKKVGGDEVMQLTNVPMNGSSWNNEGGTGRPALFARDASTSLISLFGSFAGTPIPNAKSVYMTDHKFDLGTPIGTPFGKMIQEGDFYTLSRSINVSWTVSGVTDSTTLITESTVVIWFYPTNPPLVTNIVQEDGNTNISIEGVTSESYGKTWWMETSVDVGVSDPWVIDTNGTLSGNTVVGFPIVPGQPKRFWRLMYTPNPSM